MSATDRIDHPNADYYPPARPWRVADDQVHLIGMECGHCGTKAFPIREVCAACGADSGVREVELAASGKIYSFSEVHAAPKGFRVPYVVAYVDLDDGVRLFGQVENPAPELALDQQVAVVLGEVRTKSDGTPVISYKFRGIAS